MARNITNVFEAEDLNIRVRVLGVFEHVLPVVRTISFNDEAFNSSSLRKVSLALVKKAIADQLAGTILDTLPNGIIPFVFRHANAERSCVAQYIFKDFNLEIVAVEDGQ